VVKIVADAYAWIELFSGTRKGRFVKSKMGEAESVITPDTVLAEIARKCLREGIKAQATLQRLSTILEASEPAYLDEEVAIEEAAAYTQLVKKAKDEGLAKSRLFDALVLAAARKNDARVLIGDRYFHKGSFDRMMN